MPLVAIDLNKNKSYKDLMNLVDKIKLMGVRANAETPNDAAQAMAFGAEGIGLFRTEHMFYGEGSDQPLFLLRKMIMSKTEQERKKALNDLYVFVKKDIKDTMSLFRMM